MGESLTWETAFNMSLPELNFNTNVGSGVDPKTGAITKVTNRNRNSFIAI